MKTQPLAEVPAVLRRYIDGLKAHNVDNIAAAVSDELVFVTPARVLNKEQFLSMLRALYAGFPDWHYDHDEPECRGEVIAIRCARRARIREPLLGPGSRQFLRPADR